MHHNLKACVDSFNRMTLRISAVQLRKNDRGFAVGDTCTFYEWLPQGCAGGRVITAVKIVEVFHGEGLLPGWCLLVLQLPATNIAGFMPLVVGLRALPNEQPFTVLESQNEETKDGD